MGDNSRIEWTEATWNVVTGCTRISPGCDRCYIERTVPFRTQHRRFDHEGVGGTTGVKLHSDRLHIPLRWTRPRRIFVCSLADLFHDEVPARFIAETFAVMARARQHTFQVLTKRHGRMRSLLRSADFYERVKVAIAGRAGGVPVDFTTPWWPLPNVWIGVTVENQRWANIRIPALLDTPAAVRWLSCEPLLGPLDLAKGCTYDHEGDCPTPTLDWVVVGGESGPGARPMHPSWPRIIRDQCVDAGVPFHFKQWGEWQDGSAMAGQRGEDHVIVMDGRHEPANDEHFNVQTPLARARMWRQPGADHACAISRVGKKAAGRKLDGREWDEYPTAVTVS